MKTAILVLLCVMQLSAQVPKKIIPMTHHDMQEALDLQSKDDEYLHIAYISGWEVKETLLYGETFVVEGNLKDGRRFLTYFDGERYEDDGVGKWRYNGSSESCVGEGACAFTEYGCSRGCGYRFTVKE